VFDGALPAISASLFRTSCGGTCFSPCRDLFSLPQNISPVIQGRIFFFVSSSASAPIRPRRSLTCGLSCGGLSDVPYQNLLSKNPQLSSLAASQSVIFPAGRHNKREFKACQLLTCQLDGVQLLDTVRRGRVEVGYANVR